MIIREANPDDIPGIAEVASTSFIDAFAEHTAPEVLARDVEENRSETYFEGAIGVDTILVAEIENQIVGYIQFGELTHKYIEHEDGDMDFKRLYVLTEMHSRGIGRALIDAMLAHPKIQNAQNLFVNVWDINTRAVKLYESYGFVNTGKKYPYFFDGKIDGYDDIYIKILNGSGTDA